MRLLKEDPWDGWRGGRRGVGAGMVKGGRLVDYVATRQLAPLGKEGLARVRVPRRPQVMVLN